MLFSDSQFRLLYKSMFEVLFEVAYSCQNLLSSPLRKVDECSSFKTVMHVFLENYYLTLPRNGIEKILKNMSHEKSMIISVYIISHCLDEKFHNKTHYYDFHARFQYHDFLIGDFFKHLFINFQILLSSVIMKISKILDCPPTSSKSIINIKF